LTPSPVEEARDEVEEFIRRRAGSKAEADEMEQRLRWLLEETRSDAYCEGYDEGRCSADENYCA
jgi:hypothetical protein